jgi:hypothetical protein
MRPNSTNFGSNNKSSSNISYSNNPNNTIVPGEVTGVSRFEEFYSESITPPNSPFQSPSVIYNQNVSFNKTPTRGVNFQSQILDFNKSATDRATSKIQNRSPLSFSPSHPHSVLTQQTPLTLFPSFRSPLSGFTPIDQMCVTFKLYFYLNKPLLLLNKTIRRERSKGDCKTFS